jgi:polyisoprenoid-binding protein YceI
MNRLWILALALTSVGSSADLDPAKTQIQFTLHDVLHTVHGTFQLKRGSLIFDPDSGKASGEIVVDVTSGSSGSDARDHRMHQEILENERFPEAAFIPDRVAGKLAAQGQSQIDVLGMFKIHGAGHELTLHFQVERAGTQYIASTHFTIPYPSNFVLKVDKTVDIDIKTTIHALP